MNSQNLRRKSAHERLVGVLARLAEDHRDRLEELRQHEAERVQQADWLWHALLEAAASQGNNRGYYGLIETQANYAKVRWQALAELGPEARGAVIEAALRAGKVRMARRKTQFLADSFDRIVRHGGPEAAKKKLFEAPGHEGKLKFLQEFKGIGPKYARNIMMNLYHPEFRSSIAIDSRIAGVSEAFGLSFGSYEEHEQFYLDVARSAELDGWEVDRLLFWFTDEVLRRASEALGPFAGDAVSGTPKVESAADRAELLDRVAKLEDRVDRLEELLMAQKGNPDEVGGR